MRDDHWTEDPRADSMRGLGTPIGGRGRSFKVKESDTRVAKLEGSSSETSDGDGVNTQVSPLAALAAHTRDVLSWHDQQGLILEVSPSCSNAWGYSSDELRGRLLADFIHPQDRPTLLQSQLEVLAGGDGTSRVLRFRHKSDIYVWLEVLMDAVPSADGGISIMCSSRDITARRRAEREQAERFEWADERSRMLDDLIACVPGIVWETQGALEDGEMPLSFISDQAESLLGYPIRDWFTTANLWERILHPDDKEVMALFSPSAIDMVKGNIVEYRVIAKDGRTVWLETHMLPIMSEHGELQGLRGVSLDVTARKLAEQESARMLERAEELGKKLDSLVASIPGIVWESYGSGSVEDLKPSFVSEYVEVMTGYTLDEWMADPEMWLKLVHPDDKERALEEGFRITEEGQGSLEYRWITKDGRTIWVETRETILRDEAGKVVGMRGVTLDITARKQAEEERAHLTEEMLAMQAERLAELSTPLIPISDRVMVMPLIGALDRERVENVISTLLRGMGSSHAEVAILDITGVRAVDNQIADALVRAAKSVQLLGAEVVLTGIRPEVAQILVSLDVDLRGIVTQGTLQSGIAYAMQRRGRR